MDTNIIPTKVKVSIPSGVNQSAHDRRTQITIPTMHYSDDLDEHAHVKRKRSCPMKYWSRDQKDDVISRVKDHPLNGMPRVAYMRQRNTSVHPIKKETRLSQLTNQMIGDETAIRTYSSLGHHVIACDHVTGCMECYYGNTCYSYGNYYSESLPGYYSDMASTNQSRFSHMPYYPVKLPWQRLSDVIVDRCGEMCYLEPSPKCKKKTSEAGPVIIECFSLGGNEDKEGFYKKDDRPNSTKSEEQTSPTSRQSPMATKDNNEYISKSLDTQATPINGLETSSPRLTIASSQLKDEHRHQQQQRLPIMPMEQKRPSYSDVTENVASCEGTHHTHETRYLCYSPEKDENSKKYDQNIYKVYHSKYYKRTQEKMDDCDNNNDIISTKIQQSEDVKANILNGDNVANNREERPTDVTVSISNGKAHADYMKEHNSVDTRGNSSEKQSVETDSEESRSFNETSQSDSVFPSQLEKQPTQNEKRPSNYLESPLSEKSMMLNHEDFLGNKISIHRNSVIQKRRDSLEGSRAPQRESTFDMLTPRTCDNAASKFISTTQDDDGYRCKPYLTRDDDNSSINGHDSQNLHDDLQRKISQDVIGIETTKSQRIEAFERTTSAEKSLHDAVLKQDNLHYQCQNTVKTPSPERPAIRRDSIDKEDQQRKAIYFCKESRTHPSQSYPSNSIEETSVDPCSPESFSGESWENINQDMYQGTVQNTARSKAYICEHCGREFSHVSSLNNHIRRHTGMKPFRCRFCGKRFAQSGVLTAHLRTHTGDRPFECVICKKRFAQTTTLANHIRTHTGHKPFSCRYCKKKFAQSSTRNKHELSHTKEKPYICKYCGRTFAQSATVTRHMRIHMRQDGFLCVYCGKEFPYLHALDKHLDSHSR